jgi:hypothetical protein
MTALTLSAKNRLASDARPRKAVGQESRRSEDLSSNRRTPMKYMLTWTERPQGSPIEYENAQKRILEVFTQWKARQFQDRVVRDPRRRLGLVYVAGL